MKPDFSPIRRQNYIKEFKQPPIYIKKVLIYIDFSRKNVGIVTTVDKFRNFAERNKGGRKVIDPDGKVLYEGVMLITKKRPPITKNKR